jgi:excisionase family DNA binding protein
MRKLAEEKRHGTRYCLAAPVQMNGRVVGETMNMSTCGVLFTSERSYELGQEIRFSVNLKDSTIECEGHVVRVEERRGTFAVAIELEDYNFCWRTVIMKNTRQLPERLLTPEQVAQYLNVNRFTVYRLLVQKQLPAFKVGGQWRFKRTLIEEWLMKNAIGSRKLSH